MSNQYQQQADRMSEIATKNINTAGKEFGDALSHTDKRDREQTISRLPLWSLPSRFVSSVSTWRKWYAVIFAVIAIVGNCAPAFFPSLTNFHSITLGLLIFGLIGLLYIVGSIASLVILWWPFEKGIRRNASVYREETGAGYKLVRFLFLYVFAPIIGLGIVSAFAQITSAILPHFSQAQNLHVGSSTILDIAMSGSASLEELWRWAMILGVLMLFKAFGKAGWAENRVLQRNAMIVALVVSSLFFGLGHAAEFTEYKWLAVFILGGTGAILAGVAMLSGRLWIAIVVHGIYDFLAITNLIATYAAYLYALALLGLVAVYPVWWSLEKRRQANLEGNPKRLNRQAEHHRHLQTWK